MKQRICDSTSTIYEISSSCIDGHCLASEGSAGSCGTDAEFCFLGECVSLLTLPIACTSKQDCDLPNPSPCTKGSQATLNITGFDCVEGFCKFTTESTPCDPQSLCVNGKCGGGAGSQGWGGGAG